MLLLIAFDIFDQNNDEKISDVDLYKLLSSHHKPKEEFCDYEDLVNLKRVLIENRDDEIFEGFLELYKDDVIVMID